MRIETKDAQTLIDCGFAAYDYRTELEQYDNRDAKGSGFDGMPKRRGTARGLDDELIREQNAKKKLYEKHTAFLRAQRKAMKALDAIVSGQPQQGEYVLGMRAFLKLFYVDGMPMKAAWREAGIAERTARRYKAQVVRAAKARQEKSADV